MRSFQGATATVTLDFPYAGETYSLVSALVWAIAIVLFRRTGEVVPPVPLTFFKNALALALLAATMLLLGSPLVPTDRTAVDWGILLLSGFLGLGVADILFFASLNRIGAGRSAIVDCFYLPCAVGCAWLYLREPVGPALLVAAALVVSAIALGTWEHGAKDAGGGPAPRELVLGVVFGLAAMLVMAIGVVIAKPVLARSDPWWAIAVRLVGGLALPALLAATRHRRELVRAYGSWAGWRASVPAALMGTYLSMILWILGIKFTLASKAAVLNQTSTVFTLVLAALFLREPLTRRKVAAIVLGTAGATIAAM